MLRRGFKQVEHFLINFLQLIHILCTFSQNVIGGTIYSLQTEHSSTLRRLRVRSSMTLFCVRILDNLWNDRTDISKINDFPKTILFVCQLLYRLIICSYQIFT
jgi:hypothetical protein